jgi:uncharacterized protein involved in exopolysaccharide biosynthesis
MKDSWFLYDYLRRWWWLLLSAVLFSSALGLAFVAMNAEPPEYVAKATVTITGPATVVPIVVSSIPWYSQRAAMDALDKDLTKIITYTRTPVKVSSYSVVRLGTSPNWPQNVALGSVLALLVVVGSVYVWEDTKAYRRQLMTSPIPG